MVAEPVHKRNVPVPPELRDRGGEKRLPEILRSANPHQEPKPNSNIGVTREVPVKVHIQRECHNDTVYRCETRLRENCSNSLIEKESHNRFTEVASGDPISSIQHHGSGHTLRITEPLPKILVLLNRSGSDGWRKQGITKECPGRSFRGS